MRAAVFLALFAIGRAAPAQTCTEAHRCVTEWRNASTVITAGPHLVTNGAGQVYFVNGGEVALTTTAASVLVVAGTSLVPCDGQERVEAYDVTASRVFWASYGSVCSGARYGSNTPSGAPVLARGGAGAFVVALAANASWVAYSIRLPDGSWQVRAISSSGGTPLVVANVASSHVALYGADVYWVDGLVVRTAALASVRGIETSGPSFSVGVASSRIGGLSVGPAGAFVSTETSVERVASRSTIVSEHVDGFALDATTIYWTSTRRGIVAKTPAMGGASTILASHVHPTGIAVDADNAFFVDQFQSTTAIMRIAPK